MARRSRPARAARRAFAWSAGFVLAGALYLLLIDTTQLPELLVGAGATVLAATGMELAREQRIVGERMRARWLLYAYRPLLKAPSDIVVVSAMAFRALVRRERSAGTFRAASFSDSAQTQSDGSGSDSGSGPGSGQRQHASPDSDRSRLGSGRCALALGFGSFAPNTIMIGVDQERQVILAHQLARSGGRKAIDPLELG